MSRLYSFCIALLVSIGITLTTMASWAAGQDDDVKSAYTAWDAAFQKKDAKAIAAFYADDALFLPGTHDIVRGPAGVESFFDGLFKMGVTGHKLVLIEARGEGNLLYGSANWSANGKDKDGKDQPWKGIATHIFQKGSDGKLKIKLHTFN